MIKVENYLSLKYMIKFDENYLLSRISHTLVEIEVHTGNTWLSSVIIYPSTSSLTYTYHGDPTEYAEGINGGVCGLTKKVKELKNEFWIKENNQAVDAVFKTCRGYLRCAQQDYADAWA